MGKEVRAVDARYLEKIQRKLQRRMQSGSFKVHLTAFLGVNGLLFLTWLLTPGIHPWFLYPAGAWGIGLAHHFTSRLNLKRSWEVFSKLPNLSKPTVKKVRAILANRGAFRQHATAVLATSGFLGMINAITTPFGFQWWLIPGAAMGMGLLIHHSAASHRRRIMEMELKELEQGAGIPELMTLPGSGQDTDEARRLVDAISAQIRSRPESFPVDSEMILSDLQRYLKGYDDLGIRRDELRSLLTSHSIDALRQERRELQASLEEQPPSEIAAEYRRGIEALEKQLSTLEDLAGKLEVIELQRRTLINSLRQIHLDITRYQSKTIDKHLPDIQKVHRGLDDISRYLEDFENSYREISKS